MNNPVVERELIGILRMRRTWAVLIGTVFVFSISVLLRWPGNALVDLSGTRSIQVFQLFGYSLTTMLLLLVPAYAATSFVREKKKGTLLLLLNSPLKPWAIYFGKLVGVLGFVLLLLILSLPAAAACFAMGGISLEKNLIPIYVILAGFSMQIVALGMLVSLLSSSTESALRTTYGLVLCLSVFVLVPYQFFQGQEGMLADIAVWLRTLSPIPVVMEVIEQGDLGSQGLVSSSVTLVGYSLTGAVSTLFFMVYSILLLNHTLFDRTRSQGMITDDRARSVRVSRRLLFLVDPQRRKSGIGPFVNPVMVKEFRTRRFGRIHWLMRLVALCAVLSLGLTYFTTSGTMDWGVETIGGIMVLLQVALVVLITPALASGLISSEREGRGLELLQMTPLSAGRILRGKLLSVAWTTLLILFATLPGYVVITYIKPGMRPQVIEVLICLVLTAVFALVLSATVGSFFKRTASATATSYTLLTTICGGTMLVWLGRDAPFGFEFVQSVLRINPMAAALSVIETPGLREFNLVPANWYVTGIASVVLLALLRFQTWRVMQPR